MLLYGFVMANRLFGDVLEVGCGSGVIGLLLKKEFDINLTMIDIQEINVSLARKNALNLGYECEILQEDFRSFKSEFKFDFIISNPPYYDANIKKSEDLHLNVSRYSHHLELEEFLNSANRNLKPKGELFFCYDAKKIASIFNLLAKFKLTPSAVRFIHSKEGKAAKLVLVHAKKSSRAMCEILSPIFIKSGDEFSKELEEVYKKANLKSYDVD